MLDEMVRLITKGNDMNDDWKRHFGIVSNVRFGPIIDSNGIKLFYNEDFEVKKIINALKAMLEGEDDYRSIMIAGHAGSGKTTLIHFINNILDRNCYELFIINAEKNYFPQGIIEDINVNFNTFFQQLSREIEKKDGKSEEIIKIEKNVKEILNDLSDKIVKIEERVKVMPNELFAEIITNQYGDILRQYLYAYERISEISDVSGKRIIKKLKIALDQIDLLDNNEMQNILRESFSSIINAKYITAIICARIETLESAKKSVNNFFATNFNRNLEMKSVSSEFILKNRLQAGSNRTITIKEIKETFSGSFCDFVHKSQNENIRKSLLIYEDIMKSMPVYLREESAKRYINFMLSKDYIDNIFKRINPTDKIPIIKVVFDALHFQTIVDEKFFQVVSTKLYLISRRSTGCSISNMKAAIKYLKERSIISDSFDIENRFIFTPKGEVYKRFIKTEPYLKLFCITEDDKIFIDNVFDETLFL